jgi:hypothetical protein
MAWVSDPPGSPPADDLEHVIVPSIGLTDETDRAFPFESIFDLPVDLAPVQDAASDAASETSVVTSLQS